MAKLVEIDKIWKLLETIPDPEIPVISIVDLGIIRKVEYDRNQLVISITSTYSGCPAMKFIEKEIILLLEQEGYKNVAIKMTLSPPWTTDWINTEAMEKLREEGIAPPIRKISCPHCGTDKIERISEFGSTACKAFYKCNGCLEPFEYFKCI